MKKVGKWVLIVLGGVFALLILALVVFFGWLNYEGPKTQEQKDSLTVIDGLKGPAQPANYTADLPDVEPEIYDDRNQDNNATAEEEIDQ